MQELEFKDEFLLKIMPYSIAKPHTSDLEDSIIKRIEERLNRKKAILFQLRTALFLLLAAAGTGLAMLHLLPYAKALLPGWNLNFFVLPLQLACTCAILLQAENLLKAFTRLNKDLLN